MDAIPVIPGDSLLYKFRPLDTDKHIKFAADILLNHRLYAAAPGSFNDPFDCYARYSFDATQTEKIERAVARIKKENPFISDDEARHLAPSRYMAAETYGLSKIRSLIETQLGVVSLAGNLSRLLLWAHYASGHTGIAIEFSALDLQHLDFFGRALPITYQLERPVINFYRDDLFEQVRKLLLTKSQDWAYEQEWRIVVQDREKDSDVSFDPTMIRAVYLGCKITEHKRDMVKEWISKRGCIRRPRLLQSVASETEFGLVFQELRPD